MANHYDNSQRTEITLAKCADDSGDKDIKVKTSKDVIRR